MRTTPAGSRSTPWLSSGSGGDAARRAAALTHTAPVPEAHQPWHDRRSRGVLTVEAIFGETSLPRTPPPLPALSYMDGLSSLASGRPYRNVVRTSAPRARFPMWLGLAVIKACGCTSDIGPRSHPTY